MTKLKSPIKLGESYIDERTSIQGHAVAIFFNENDCVEVVLENTKEGEVKRHFFNQNRLRCVATEKPKPSTYETDVEFGKEYIDNQTRITGWPAVLEFHEGMANRTSLRSRGEDRDGNAKLVYHSIDDFLLAPVDGGPKAARKDDKPSPVARQVDRPGSI